MKVIAEGIETGQQRDFLQQQGCDYGQGNLFSPALSPGELALVGDIVSRWQKRGEKR
ncbi:MAG: EAL domain-containing protein [Gammaproteobacteria bacterium]